MLWSYNMSYEGSRLRELTLYRFLTPADSVAERKVELFYSTSGNLSSYKDYWRNGSGMLTLSTTFVFSEYDNGTNVDDFYLFKNFFEDVLFLPQVKIQRNNPGLVQIKGAENDYEIRYNYTYQNGLPIQKQGVFRQTRGSGSGGTTNLLTTFSYY